MNARHTWEYDGWQSYHDEDMVIADEWAESSKNGPPSRSHAG